VFFFKSIDLGFTNSNKEAVTESYTHFRKVSFLKRGFRAHPSRREMMLAPIAIDSVEGSLHWIRKSPDDVEMSYQTTLDASRLAFSRGREYYDDFCERMRNVWATCGRSISFPDWDSLDCRVYDYGDSLSDLMGAWHTIK